MKVVSKKEISLRFLRQSNRPSAEMDFYPNYTASSLSAVDKLSVSALPPSWPLDVDQPIAVLFAHYLRVYEAAKRLVATPRVIVVVYEKTSPPGEFWQAKVQNQSEGEVNVLVTVPEGEHIHVDSSLEKGKGILVHAGKSSVQVFRSDAPLGNVQSEQGSMPHQVGNTIDSPVALASPLIRQVANFPDFYRIAGYYAVDAKTALARAKNPRLVSDRELSALEAGVYTKQPEIPGRDFSKPPWTEWEQAIIYRIRLERRLDIVE